MKRQYIIPMVNLDLNKADTFIKEIENIEEEQVAQYVVGPLKQRLATEAKSLNLISKKNATTLPL